jgi:hypothetical protein
VELYAIYIVFAHMTEIDGEDDDDTMPNTLAQLTPHEADAEAEQLEVAQEFCNTITTLLPKRTVIQRCPS